MTLNIEETVSKLAEGGALSEPEVCAVADTRDLIALGMLADAVRRRHHGAATTFLRVLEVGVLDAADDLRPADVGEWRVVGAVPDPETVGRIVDAVVRVARGTPVSGLSLSDIETWCVTHSRPLPDMLRFLRARGLERIAEAPMDELAQPERAFEAVVEAGLTVERITVARVVDDWPALHGRIDSVRRAVGPVGRFAPLPRGDEAKASTGYDDVRQIAWARLMLGGVESIQVDWTLHGPKLAQVSLAFGVDDVDAVVSPGEPETAPRRTLAADIRRNIEAASLEPHERDGRSEPVKPA